MATAEDDGKPSGSDRAAALLAQMDAAKAAAHDAHVDAWWDFALCGSLLLQLKSHDAAEREAAARSLLGFAAWHLATDSPLPVPLRKWLAAALHQAARTGDAAAALRLNAKRGNYAYAFRDMRNVGQIHALMRWRGLSRGAAALAVLPTSVRARGGLGSVEDASVLEKQYTKIDKDWVIAGPFLADSDGRPQREATADDLKKGSSVTVTFEHRKFRDNSYSVLLPTELTQAA